MSKDPLSYFLDEKTAAASAPDFSQEEIKQRPFTRNPDPESMDPGERAAVGILAAGGGAIGTAATTVLNQLMLSAAEGGAVDITKFERPWHQATGWPQGKLMGLFDVKTRKPIIPAAAIAEEKNLQRYIDKEWPKVLQAEERGDKKFVKNFYSNVQKQVKHPVNKAIWAADNELEAIDKTVNHFMSKHRLSEKGVSVHLKQGPLNWMFGPRYETITKRVYLPMVSKEVALHELGHAADYTAGRVGRARKVIEPLIGKGVRFALPAALIAGDQIAEALPGTIDDKAIKFMQDNAPAIMGATIAATTLYPEAKASLLALRHIKQTEGRAAAMKSFKRLAPAFGTYVLGAIPAVVGMALARKYMREARGEKALTQDLISNKMSELEKEGGVVDIVTGIPDMVRSAVRFGRSSTRDIVHIGRQVGEQTGQIISDRKVLQSLSNAAKEVGTSPEFVHGAFSSALPAATAALYLYGTQSGKMIRERTSPEDREESYSGSSKGVPFARRKNESWREAHPARFAGLVALGAAMSAGIMTKLYSDLARVL